MVPEFGHFALILALGLSLALVILPAVGIAKNDTLLMRSGGFIAGGIFTFLVLSFICLMESFLADDFSVQYVANNSNSALPVQYKISAIWGGSRRLFPAVDSHHGRLDASGRFFQWITDNGHESPCLECHGRFECRVHCLYSVRVEPFRQIFAVLSG